MAAGELHLDRARAGSFGSVAEQYDRYRSAYPEALINDLAAQRPARVLDVGCGTGKAAVALAGHGLTVLGVELDDRMAAIARGYGIAVEVSTFETWDDAGRRFDLITCGEAWHWIDPVLGLRKAAEVLSPGGTLARFWTTSAVDEPVAAAFDAVYRRYASEVSPVWRPTTKANWHTLGDSAECSPAQEAFSPVEATTYRWERTLSADDWVGLAATVSDHQRLGPERLGALLRALHRTILELGGSVHSVQETYLLSTRRV